MIYNPARMNLDRARLFDKRVVQRNIRAGRVTKDEYRAWLRELSDTSEKIRARDEGGDDDGYERPEPGGGASVSVAAIDVSAHATQEPPHGEAG